MPGRVYIQYQPTVEYHTELLQVQHEALAVNPGARPVPAQELHLTVIHYGILMSVYDELSTALPYEAYEAAVERFVSAAEAACPPAVVLTPTGYELFGPNHHVLVIRFKATAALQAAHEASLAALIRLFKECDVADPMAWMRQNNNFQYALTLSPHLTLLRKATVPPPTLPGAAITFRLSPPRFDLKKPL